MNADDVTAVRALIGLKRRARGRERGGEGGGEEGEETGDVYR